MESSESLGDYILASLEDACFQQRFGKLSEGLLLYLLILRTMVLMASRKVIQAIVTRKPLYTGAHSSPQPRLMIPRSASHANVWGRT